MSTSGTEAPVGAAEQIPLEHIEDALNAVSGGRSIALTLMIQPNEYVVPVETEKYFNSSLAAYGREERLSQGYSRTMFGRMPESIVLPVGTDHVEVASFLGRELAGSSRAFGAYITKLSEQFDIAPVDLTGAKGHAAGPEGFPPNFARLALYAGLFQTGGGKSISTSELSQQTGINLSVAHNHVPGLIRGGIVLPSSNGRRASLPRFAACESETEINPDNISLPAGWRPTTQQLALEALALVQDADHPLSVTEVRLLLAEKALVAELIESPHVHKQNEILTKVMKWLGDNGHLDEVDGGIQRINHLVVSQRGWALINRYLTLFAQFVQKDEAFLERGNRFAKTIAADRFRVARLLTIDFDKGAIVPSQSQNERAERIKQILRDHPHGIATPVLQAETGHSSERVHKDMKTLEKAGSAYGKRVGRSMVWFATASTG